MKPKSVSAVVYNVADLGKTIAFYEGLGFRIGKNDGRVAVVYVNWFAIEFHQTNDIDDNPKDGPIMLVSVDDVAAYYESALAASYTPVHEPKPTVNGRKEFTLQDPNGYTVVFFEK